MENITLDIVIPSLNEDQGTLSLLESIRKQKNITVKNVVLPITLKYKEPKNDLHDRIKNLPYVKFFDVKPEEFSHSLTREKAILEYCTSDTVILMSNDVKLTGEDALYNLAKDVHDKKVAFAYGKQVCPKNCIEKYIRDKNYSDESKIVSKDDIEQMQTMAFFSSDAFSCLDREIFIKIEGYQGLNLYTNEDMYYSYQILMNGYLKKYCANAVVEHYHNYKIKDIYQRYYLTGLFYKQVKVFDQYKNTSTGFTLALKVLGQSLKHFDIKSLFLWLPNMAARYLGFKKGLKK